MALLALAVPASSAAATSGLIGQWHFDEGSGTVAADSSGNNDTGNLFPLTGPPQWVAGRFGTALSFNGSDGVEIPDNGHSVLDSATSAISVSAWVMHTGSPGDYRYMIAKGASGCDSASYGLYTGPRGGLSFYISNPQSSGIADYNLSPEAGDGVWDGNWHLVVGTFDGSALRLYVDGVEIGAGTPFSGPIDYARASNTNLYIGYYPAPQGCLAGGFTGAIDEPAVWNFALSAAQVSAMEPTSASTSPGAQPQPPTQPSPTTTGTGTDTGNRTHHSSSPALSHLRISPSTLAIPTKRHHAKRKSRGMTITYTDTQAAVSSFSVLLPRSGVVKRGKCVTSKGKVAKHAKRCTRSQVIGKFAHADRAGTNRFAFTAVTVLQLAPHRYLLDATPNAHGGTGKTVRTAFTIKR